MKHFLPFTLLVLFFWGCQKATFEYAVVCEFPLSLGPEGSTTLVITDDQGDVAGHFPISSSSTSFNQKFTFQARNASERFGVHLVTVTEVYKANYFFITSHCGVPNGASVTLAPERFSLAGSGTSRIVPVRIDGVTVVDSIKLMSQPYWVFSPQKDVWFSNIVVLTGQVNVMRIFANGEKVERTFILQESNFPSDTLRLNFNDLDVGYKVSNFEVKLPADKTGYFAQVDMVSPDYKGFIHLATAHENYNSPSKLSVTKPDAIPNDWLIHVKFSDALSSSERLFIPGEPLEVTRPTGFGIVSATSEPGQSISVRTEGEVDLVRASTFWNDPNSQQYVNWTIDGNTETFKYLELPELKRFLPNTDLFSSSFKNFRISLFNLKDIDYEQVRSGFPWRSSGIYPVGRSNLRTIHKSY